MVVLQGLTLSVYFSSGFWFVQFDFCYDLVSVDPLSAVTVKTGFNDDHRQLFQSTVYSSPCFVVCKSVPDSPGSIFYSHYVLVLNFLFFSFALLLFKKFHSLVKFLLPEHSPAIASSNNQPFKY